jgi:hypothetical protein
MIERIKHDDALNATEELLLVPVPVGATVIEDGFAGQVLRAYPLAESRLQTRGGLGEGEALLVGTVAGDYRWHPLYSLVLTALHHRRPGGWDEAPKVLAGVLEGLHERFAKDRLAVAGTPGAGFSGLRNGAANQGEMLAVLETTEIAVTIYDRQESGDREGLAYADPLRSDSVAREVPNQFV